MTEKDLIAFEKKIQTAWEAGELPILLHLCGGNEEELVSGFQKVKPGDWIFSTHRAHYHALLAGIPPDEVEAKIRKGKSMFIYSKEHNFLCSAILAGCAGIAAGVAWQLKEEGSLNQVICFQSDGSEEEGHLYEAALFVEANNLPCTFVIEDNGRQVDTPKRVRRGMYSKGLEDLFKCVVRYHYTPTYPHAGSGCNFQIQFNPKAVSDHTARQR
jgi:TPP-dependent pyruvate/acetoin dehydrogenase alpha subunit